MKQIKFPNFVQHALKGAALESVAEMPAHPVEGRIVLDKTGGANDGQAVMYSGAAWSQVGAPQTGTWTPVIKGSGGTTMTLTTATGHYAKNGRVVECWVFVQSASAMNDPLYNFIPTLPFTPAETLQMAGEASSPQGANGESSMHRIYVQPSAGLQCIMYAAQYGGVITPFTSQISGHFTYLTNA